MRNLLWALLIVGAVLGISSAIYTCDYHQEDPQYVLYDDVLTATTHSNATVHATDNGDEHVLQTHLKPGRLSVLFNDTTPCNCKQQKPMALTPSPTFSRLFT